MTDRVDFEAFIAAWKSLPERWRLYYFLAFQWHCVPAWGRVIIILQLLIITITIIVLALK